MMELGNTAINNIYEANYLEECTINGAKVDGPSTISPERRIVRAKADSNNTAREAWIKAKYIDKSFVIPLNAVRSSNVLEKTNCLKDIIFSGNGMWHIQRRRGNSTTLREEHIESADQQSTNSDSPSSSESSTDSNVTSDSLSIRSSELTDDQEETLTTSVESYIKHLNCDSLLYNAAAVKHVPIMCYAIACGATQYWTNETDTFRTALHRAVLSVQRYFRKL